MVVDVTPRTDAWLVAPERTWDEVDGILDGRLQVLEQAFQNPQGNRVKAAEAYGIERGVDRDMARFLAYVELLDEYRVVEETHAKKANGLRESFESEKGQIKAGPGGQGKKRQKIENLWRTTYNARINEQTALTDQTNKVKIFLLRKAVLDIFSVTESSNIPLSSLAKIASDAKTYLSENPEDYERLRERKPVEYFLSSLSDFFSKTRDTELQSRFNYRNSRVLVSDREDCKILETTLIYVFDPDSVTAGTEIKTKLAEIGKSFFEFLTRRAVSTSSTSRIASGEYPILSLMYDIFTSSMYQARMSLIRGSKDIIEGLFADFVNSSRLRDEIRQCVAKNAYYEAEMMDFLQSRPSLQEVNSDEIDVPATLPSYFVDYLISSELRLYRGIVSVTGFATNDYLILPILRNQNTAKRVAQKMIHVAKTLLEAYAKKYELFGEGVAKSYMFISDLPYMKLIERNGIEVDLASIVSIYIDPTVISEISPDRGEFFDHFRRMIESDSFSSDAELQSLALHDYLLCYWVDDERSLESVEKENNTLWREILDNQIWFVSPRGDRFSDKRNPDLIDKAVDSVSFNIDREHPREYKIDFRINGIDKQFTLWFDTNRNLLGTARQILRIDPKGRQFFLNMLLKRLYAITSGQMSEKRDIKVGEEGSRIFDYKRAHYRFLTSTDKRPITMESHGAQVHAREVKEDYGIDIFAEIRRRRNIGTLPPNQYLTFVRETTPGVKGVLILPNELTFDPDLIQIPSA